MNTRKSLKSYNVGYTFEVQTVFKTNKHKNFEYCDQIILMQAKKKRCKQKKKFQASFDYLRYTFHSRQRNFKE